MRHALAHPVGGLFLYLRALFRRRILLTPVVIDGINASNG
jgi:hypothetical protein